MKRKLLFSLFLAFLGYANAAEQIRSKEELLSNVESLQLIALKFIQKKSIAFGIKENFLGRPCPSDVNSYVNKQIARIAVDEFKKESNFRLCPYEQFKRENPDIALFLEARKITYSLSLGDLFSMKARMDFENEEYGNDPDDYYEEEDHEIDLSTLGLTSLEGIESVGVLGDIPNLNVSNNQLTTIEPMVFQLFNLIFLDFSYNYLGENLTLDPLIFTQLGHLERLNLSGNTSKKDYSQHNFFHSDNSDDNEYCSDEDGYNSKRLCFSKSPSIYNSENDDFSGIKDEDVL